MMWLLWLACGTVAPPAQPFVEVIVVRGDTLGKLARAHNVTVVELQTWNGLSTDVIEVGQVLRLIPGNGPSPRQGRTRRPAAVSAGPGVDEALMMPTARPCLAAPTADGLADEGIAVSQGLDAGAADRALDAFVGHTLRCADPDAEPPEGEIVVELVVGCDGVVDSAVVVGGRWPQAQGNCVANVLRHTPMPVHDLPDGDALRYPVRWTR